MSLLQITVRYVFNNDRAEIIMTFKCLNLINYNNVKLFPDFKSAMAKI